VLPLSWIIPARVDEQALMALERTCTVALSTNADLQPAVPRSFVIGIRKT
jgi:hypothetical protein